MMNQLTRTTSLLLVMLGVFAQASLRAQPHPVFLRWRGAAVDNIPGYGTDLQLAGNFAYLAWAADRWTGDTNHPGGLGIFSVTNPCAPQLVGGYESPAQANGVNIVGHYAYLAEGTVQTFTNDPGIFEIIDVGNPANPVRVGAINTLGRANAIRVAGHFAFVAESTRWTGTNLLGAMEIFDVSTPTNPVRVAIFDTVGSATSVDVSDHYVYLADGVTDLQVLDVSDPGNPQQVGVYLSDVARNACGFEPGGPAKYVQVVGNLAYSAGDNGLHVLDISDPSHPASIGDNFCFPIQSFRVSDQSLYATIWSSWANTFILRVLDNNNPANLIWVGSKANWNSRVFQVAGNLVYLATNPLSIYEISDRPAITSISAMDDTLFLSWDPSPGFVLQRSISLVDPLWSNVPGSTNVSSINLPLTNSSEFFRLAKP